jgi:hypothetical protein
MLWVGKVKNCDTFEDAYNKYPQKRAPLGDLVFSKSNKKHFCTFTNCKNIKKGKICKGHNYNFHINWKHKTDDLLHKDISVDRVLSFSVLYKFDKPTRPKRPKKWYSELCRFRGCYQTRQAKNIHLTNCQENKILKWASLNCSSKFLV